MLVCTESNKIEQESSQFALISFCHFAKKTHNLRCQSAVPKTIISYKPPTVSIQAKKEQQMWFFSVMLAATNNPAWTSE